MTKISFNNKNNPFFKSLKAKVDQHFISRKTNVTGNYKLYIKSILQICSAIGLYLSIGFIDLGPFFTILLYALLGANLAFIGFNIMHEGGHQSFSKVKWINKTTAYFLNILGGNALFWKIKHNINHHTYTNIEGMDHDLEVEPYMRLHPEQKRFWIHRFQHIYWVLLYGLSYFSWVFIDDFVKYFSGKIATGSENMEMRVKDHVIFWATKLSYLALYLGFPALLLGFWPALAGMAVMMFVCGLTIAVVFQLAHVVEDTTFPHPSIETNKIEQEWAIHQVQTTANFGTRNPFLSWFLGGLNFQVEHHLFPKISHVHYPAINKLVKETCKEFNIRYIEYPSLFHAFRSHLMHIKKMGICEQVSAI